MSTIFVNTPMGLQEVFVSDEGPICNGCDEPLVEHDGTFGLMRSNGSYKIECLRNKKGVIIFDEFPRVSYREKKGTFCIWKPRAGDEFPLPHGCDDVDYGKDYAIFVFGHAKIKVSGKVLTPDNILCDKIYKFKSSGEDYNIPDYPVLFEYMDCIQRAGQKKLTCRESDTNHTWELTLRGLSKPVKVTKTLEPTTARASIWLWPDFIHPDWRINLVRGEFDREFFTEARGQKITVNILDSVDKGSPVELVSGSAESLKDVKAVSVNGGRPLVMEIKVGHDISCGIYEDYRASVIDSRKDEVDRLSLDFGTSNTALAYTYKQGDEGHIIKFSDHSVDRFALELNKDDIVWYSDFLPTFRMPPTPSIPSVLMGKLSLADRLFETSSQFATIAHSSFLVEEATGVTAEMAENFKWKAPPRYNRASLVKAYLKLTMLLAMAEIKEVNSVKEFIVTYPAAFDFSLLEDYTKIIKEDLKKFLRESLGVSVDKTLFGNESLAVARYHSMSVDKDYLILDLGGGTLDIALFEDKEVSDENGKRKRKRELKIIDSLEYACRDFIDALSDRKFCPKLKGKPGLPAIDPDDNYTSIKLGQWFRNARVKEALILQENEEDEYRQTLLLSFFEGIFHLVRKLAHSHDKADKLQVVLSGNGWGLLTGVRGAKEAICEETESIIKRQHTMPDKKIFKCDISAKTAYPVQYAEEPKSHVSIGALNVSSEQLSETPEKDIDTASQIKTIVGFNVDDYGSQIGWDEEVPVPLNHIKCSRLNDQITDKWAKLELKPVNEVDKLEEALCQKYIRPRGTGKLPHLEKGVFAVYLEKFFKEKLRDCKWTL